MNTVLIKQAFEKMEYSNILEPTDLAKSWLEARKRIGSFFENRMLEGKSVAVYDINCDDSSPIILVNIPKLEDAEKVITESSTNEEWFKVPPCKKAFLIERLAKEIGKHTDQICQLEILIRGIAKHDTKHKALALLIEYFQYYAGWAIKYNKEKVNWKPNKVAAGILSDKSYLAMVGSILGPALAAGYNIILQTEPRISVIVAYIIELAESVGIPKGTVKLMPGNENLELIFKSAYVGIICHYGSENMIKSADGSDLEKPIGKKFVSVVNSKSSMIVFNTADIDSACNSAINACWRYQGMLPWSIDTLLVQEDIFETVVTKIKHRLSNIRMGLSSNQLSYLTYPRIMNLKNHSISERLTSIVDTAKSHGIEVFQPSLNKLDNNEIFCPTLLIGQKLFSTKRVLGEDEDLPVLSIIAFRTTTEGINLMNNTRYGFSASVWTENIGLANEMIRKLKFGNIWINNHGQFMASASFTTYKKSGTGYFGGKEGFLEFVSPSVFSMPTVTSNQEKKANLAGIVTAANKGHEEWIKQSCLMRSQALKNVFDQLISESEISCNILSVTQQHLEDWAASVYEGSVQIIDLLGSVSRNKSYELRTIREAVGTIVIEDDNCQFLNVIIGALLLGNSVIILNFNSKNSTFLNEMSRIYINHSIPNGVFNVVLNANESVWEDLKAYKELNVYFTTYHKLLNTIKYKDHVRIYSETKDWMQIVTSTTKNKNVWSTIGDSF